MLPQLYVEGQPVQLGKRIGKGGEGEVYTIEDRNGLAIKYYTLTDLSSRHAKIAAMIRANLGDACRLVAFPKAIVTDSGSRFKGFVMALVADCKPLHELYGVGSRKQHFPGADYRFLVRAALNIARAVSQVHDAGCVIGDINHSGVLISQKAIAALIDADSFQIKDGNNVLHCKVGVPEYTPPELQGQKLDQIVRTPNHDSFGLAVVIFQLLFMGRHPFAGRFRGQGDMPLERAIGEYRFVYSRTRQVSMMPPPGVSDLDDIPNAVADLFERAFAQESCDQRPKASQWVAALDQLEKTLVKCGSNALHYYSNAARSCPWCDMEQNTGTALFVPDVAQWASHVFTSGRFDAGRILQQLNSLNLATLGQFPPVSQLKGQVSQAARKTVLNRERATLINVVVVAVALSLIIFNPAGWAYFVGAGVLALWSVNRAQPGQDARKLAERASLAAKRWDQAIKQWRDGLELDRLAARYFEVEAWLKEHQGLTSEYNVQLHLVEKAHRERQLDDYLDTFSIEDEFRKKRLQVRGLGIGKIMDLYNDGIDTFADVKEDDCLNVDGIGPAITRGLLSHKAKLAAGFRPQSQMSAAEKQDRMNLGSTFKNRAQTLQIKIETSLKEVMRLASHAKAASQHQRTVVVEARQALLDAVADVEHLGGVISAPLNVPANPLAQTVRTSSIGMQLNAVSPITGQPNISPPLCPRCQSTMIKRTNRKQRNSFWGCSTYPSCKGTRNYP